jgi:hypothetical protein
MTTLAADRAVTVPTLAEVVAEPEKADQLPGRVVLGLLGELLGTQHRLMLRMLAVGLEPVPPRKEEDRLLTIEEAAATLRIAPATAQKWLRREPYRRAVVVRSRTCVRVSAQLLEQVIHGGAVRLTPRPRGAGRP